MSVVGISERDRHFGWKLNLSPLYFQETNCPEMRFGHEKGEKGKKKHSRSDIFLCNEELYAVQLRVKKRG